MKTLTKSFSEFEKCTECGGSGWIDFRKPASEVRVDGKQIYGENANGYLVFVRKCPSCNGGEHKIVHHAKRSANIPPAFYDAEFNAFDWTIYRDDDGKPCDLSVQKKLATSFIMDYPTWSERGIGLYIWSKTRGSGKTFLASTICNTLIRDRKIKTKFVSVSNLIDLVNESRKNGTTSPIVDLCECDVLVLDDLGQQNSPSDWLLDILFKICDQRMQNRKVTIATSNRKLMELKLDDRILDRLNMMCQPIPLPDYCVRSTEAVKEKRQLLIDLGLIEGKAQMELDLAQKGKETT